MNRISIIIIFVLLSLGAVVGCSVLKGNDAEEKVRKYLAQFSADVQQADSLAVRHFRTNLSAWELNSAIQLLRNEFNSQGMYDESEEERKITVIASFQQADVQIMDSILVTIPITLTADSAGIASQRQISLNMTLVQQDTTFVITRWNGFDFYEACWSYNSAIIEGNNLQKIRESRGHFYARAQELQKTYDSVVWFSRANNAEYYYVVKGDWGYAYDQPLHVTQYTMGLVNAKGKEIIPPVFDLIGMPGEAGDDIIEVKKNDLFGYYQLSTGHELLPAVYDWIIPYSSAQIIALVKKDKSPGWIDPQYTFHEGYPTAEAEKYIRTFSFLPDEITLNNADAAYLEIPSEQYAAVGYTIPASYFTYFGIFREIEGDFQGEIFNEQAGREYKESKIGFFDKVTDTFAALITQVRDSYVFSREGFYDHQKITLINQSGETFNNLDLNFAGKISFKMIDSTLLEIKASEGYSNDYQVMEYNKETTTPMYVYCSLVPGQALTQLETQRAHPCTKFVKLDSSYVMGNFTYYRENLDNTQETRLSDITLHEMRNDILAEYGYIFKDDVKEAYKYRDWYKPQYATVADFEKELSEIDRHNLKFLEKFLGPVDGSTPLI